MHLRTICSVSLLAVIFILPLQTGMVKAATVEISGAVQLTNNSDKYDRNPSIIKYGGEYWLFYTRADNGSTNGVRGPDYNPDNDSYVIWYKTASTIEGLAQASETELSLSETDRPVGFDQRDVSAAILNGNLYVFASAGWGGSPQPIYYYTWNGSWSGPTSLGNSGGGHAHVAYDANRVYIVEEAGYDVTLQSLAYTWDGTTLNGPYTIANGNGVPKVTLLSGNLYVVSIAPGATTINLHTSAASASPSAWTYLSDPISVSGSYVWDPCIFNDGTNLYAVAAPSTSSPDQQWLVQAKSTDNGISWSTQRKVSYGGYETTYWWDFWPCGFYDGTDLYLFFATEDNGHVYGDGEIAYTKMDWNLNHDHYFYIQNGVDGGIAGDTVSVAAGKYVETIVIGRPLTLLGAGQDYVTVYPDSSDIGLPTPPDPPSFRGSQLVVVQADNVTIDGFTFDGDNPDLTPVGTLDARNGIITNYNLGNWDSLTVSHCTVRNIYFRGIYATALSSISGIDFEHNSVHNVKGVSMQSAGIMLWNGSGLINDNTCTDISQGIFLHSGSSGIVRLNQVDSCDLGIGANGNSSQIGIFANRISDSNQGVQTIAIGAPVVLMGDTIENCEYGLVLFGLGSSQTDMSGSLINGRNASGSIGIYASTDVSPYGVGDVFGFINTSSILNNWIGIVLNEPSSNTAKNVLVSFGTAGGLQNSIYDNDSFNLYMEDCNDNINATFNYWGKSLISQIEDDIYHQVDVPTLGLVDFSHPYLLGDVNIDGVIDVGDVVYLINYLFKNGTAPYMMLLGDVNRDDNIDVSDVVFLINYLFKNGPPPVNFTEGGKTVEFKGLLPRPANVYELIK
jgi:parallel beta-helix repeat protein